MLFRSLKDPWSSDGARWSLVQEGLAWRLVDGVNVLTSITSHTARALSRVFDSIENEQYIHTVVETTTQSVLISLPRLQLDFSIGPRDRSIHSRQYRGMVVDPDQTMGTLIGLSSKLILRPTDPWQDRIVLVPLPRVFDSDAVSYTRVCSQHHISVTIDQNQANGVYAYSLDNKLGRILDSGGVQRKLFLAFLHAATSHCLPDPLTGYTGTESALRILHSAALRSFEILTVDNVALLHQIAALAPIRAFYPTHLMNMQQIQWNKDLTVLSSHPRLRTEAHDIIRQAQRMRLSYPHNMPDISKWKSSDSHLEARDAIRSSTFRICNFGAEQFTSMADTVYRARDVHPSSESDQRAYVAAKLIVRDQAAIHKTLPDLKRALL